MVEHMKIRVKPLEWVEDTETTTDDDGVPRVLKAWRAGPYTIIRQHGLHGRFILSWKSDGVPLVMPTLAAAQAAARAAAQAVYERRILNSFDDLVAALKEGRRAIGDHNAPHDCYATGPLTGDPIRDLVQCPACSFIAMYEDVLSRAGAA